MRRTRLPPAFRPIPRGDILPLLQEEAPFARAVPKHALRVVGTGSANELAHAHTFKAAGALEDIVLDRPDPHLQHLRSFWTMWRKSPAP